MPQNPESKEPRRGGHFSSYETTEIQKTLVNLLIDKRAQENMLRGLDELEIMCHEHRIWHEFSSNHERAHGRISQRLGYTNSLICDARRELETRGFTE